MAHANASAGIVLAHGKVLITAENSGASFFDIAALISGFIRTVRGSPAGGVGARYWS